MRGFKMSALWVAVALAAAPLALAQSAHPLADAAKQRIQRELARRAGIATTTTATTTTAPAADQPVSVVVPATQEWAPTRVTVQAGGRLQINATDGRWTTVRQSVTAVARVATPTATADGFPERTSPQSLVPTANIAALIGKIGPNGTPFAVGSKYDGTAPADGELLLAINDQAGAFADNSGRVAVAITYTAPPPPAPNPEQPAGVPTTTDTTTQAPPETTTTATSAPPGANAPPTATTEAAPAEPASPIEPASLPPWAIPVGIGAFLIGAILLWPRPKPPSTRARKPVQRAGVSARIVSDGRNGQNLKVQWKDHK
ncbi:MAG: LecA/PA-IL family lectin [Pseudomonadota bacterium]